MTTDEPPLTARLADLYELRRRVDRAIEVEKRRAERLRTTQLIGTDTEIRAWAVANDIPVAPRGRISKALRLRYSQAHTTTTASG